MGAGVQQFGGEQRECANGQEPQPGRCGVRRRAVDERVDPRGMDFYTIHDAPRSGMLVVLEVAAGADQDNFVTEDFPVLQVVLQRLFVK